MHCDDPTRWRAMIIDRLADELGEEDAVLLEQHLGECPTCLREARGLAGLLARAAGPVEWAPVAALEDRLAAALVPGPTPAPQAQRANVFGRWPMPAIAAAALVIVAAAAGFWTGRTRPASEPRGAIFAAREWVAAPADANRVPPPTSGAARPAVDLLVSTPSFARHDPSARERAADVGFAPAYSDAIELPGRMPADSL